MPEDGATTVVTAPAPPPTVPTTGDQAPTLAGMDTRTLDMDGTTGAGFGGHDPSDHGPLTIGQVFGTRYHIIKLLGVGGMGAVYQAWDEELAVAVAIKVIRPEVMADPIAAADIERRFKRELLLAREVTHRNVVRIHDLGEIDGIKYITMAYVDGIDLATLIRREGKVAPAKALRIARSVVSGLVAAHGANVVHRDLKPANIMVDKHDDALIMDFGIARSTAEPVTKSALSDRQSPAAPSRPLRSKYTDATAIGSIVGTVEYMAPEQAKGVEVDQRADVYAFGLILYDMLTGRRRAELASSAFSELQARMEQAPTAVKEVVPDVPEALDRLVSRCIDPDREKRFQSTTELAVELGRLDENGEPIPIKRVVGMKVLAAVVVLAVTLLGGNWWYASRMMPAVQHEPVSVLIADFENRTQDPAFEGSLEQALAIAVEGASFITSYDRYEARKVLATVKPGTRLDETSARLVATREGIKVILAGAIERQGDGYAISLKGVNPDDGKALWTETATASSRNEVLASIGSLAAAIRSDVGDTAPQSARMAAAESVTASSLDALRAYSLAQDLFGAGKTEESVRYFQEAIARDPGFGRAYAGYATSAYHLGRKDEAAELWKKALSMMDRMTEREKYRTLGTYYLAIARNYEQAIDNYEKLVNLYPTDLAGHNNLAFSYFSVLNFPKALEEGRKAVALYPRKLVFRNNYALYAMYASDFTTAAKEAETLVKDEPGFAKNYLPLAVAAMAGGDYDGARGAYERMAKTGDEGASLAAMGLADLALYQGRYRDAEQILTAGVGEDQRTKNSAALAAKQIALAETYQATGRPALALKTVKAALDHGRQESVLVPAARIYLRAGRIKEATDLAAELDNQLQTQARAYAKIIDGSVAAGNRRLASAIEAFRGAAKLADFWMAHFDIGLTYAQAGPAHAAEALGELEACMKRRGEATAIFLDDTPSFRYLSSLPYWLARAQEGVGQHAAAMANYNAFLALRPESAADPLVVDARKRVGS